MYYDEVKAFALAVNATVRGDINDSLSRNLVVNRFELFADAFDLNNDDNFAVCVCNESNNTPEIIDANALVITIAVFDVEEVYEVECPSIVAEYCIIIDPEGVELITEDGSEVIA